MTDKKNHRRFLVGNPDYQSVMYADSVNGFENKMGGWVILMTIAEARSMRKTLKAVPTSIFEVVPYKEKKKKE